MSVVHICVNSKSLLLCCSCFCCCCCWRWWLAAVVGDAGDAGDVVCVNVAGAWQVSAVLGPHICVRPSLWGGSVRSLELFSGNCCDCFSFVRLLVVC